VDWIGPLAGESVLSDCMFARVSIISVFLRFCSAGVSQLVLHCSLKVHAQDQVRSQVRVIAVCTACRLSKYVDFDT